jgi:hypothetical protein
MIDSSVHLVLRPTREWSGRVTDLRVDRMTQGKPRLDNTEVAVKLNLHVDERMFQQFLPEVDVTITSIRDLITPDVDVDHPSQPEEGEGEEATAA